MPTQPSLGQAKRCPPEAQLQQVMPSLQPGIHRCDGWHEKYCVLCSPVYVCPDPIRGEDNVLVLCEVFYPDGTPHETNTRAKLEALIDDKVRAEKPLYGFEQVSCLS